MKKDVSGPNHPSWKGGRHVRGDGYAKVWDPSHPNANKNGYVFEHVAVMSKLINRGLYADEEVHHIDENPSNNDPSNLMLERIGLHRKKHHRTMKVLTQEDVADVIKYYKEGLSASHIGRKFNCSATSILSHLRKNDIGIRDSGSYSKVFNKGRSKLTEEQWKSLYNEYGSEEKPPVKYLAKKYGISKAMVPRGLKARGYKIRKSGWQK